MACCEDCGKKKEKKPSGCGGKKRILPPNDDRPSRPRLWVRGKRTPEHLIKVGHPGFKGKPWRNNLYFPTRHKFAMRPRGLFRLVPNFRGRLFTIPMIWSGTPCFPITETLLPTSTVTNGDWNDSVGCSTAWNCLDDIGDDSENMATDDLVWTDEVCGNTAAHQNLEVHIANPSGTPADSSCQKITMRWRIADLTDDGERFGCVDWLARTTEGATQRIVQGENDVGTGGTTKNQTISDVQYDGISNHNDMRITIDADCGGESPTPKVPSQGFAIAAQLLYEPK